MSSILSYRYFFILLLLAIPGPVLAQNQVPIEPGNSLNGNFNHTWVDSVLDHLSLTGIHMKPGYPFDKSRNIIFPWFIPVGGITGAGALTYVLVNKGKKTGDCAFNASAQATSSTCGLANGSARIDLPSPDEYAIFWSNGESTATIQQVSAGMYSARVSRIGTECTQQVNVTIENLNPVFDATISSTSAHCGLADGSATVSVNPSGSYQFTWSDGSNGSGLVNVRSGFYMVTVSAGGACTKIYEVQIDELPPAFSIDVSQTPATCGSSNGSAIAQVLPAGEYNYLWSNGATTPRITGLAAGEYQITVTLSTTVCQIADRVVIEDLPPDYDIRITTSEAGCGLNNGTASAMVGPPGEYLYLWPDGSTLPESQGLAPGDYALTITNRNGCVSKANFSITEKPADVSLEIMTLPAHCTGGGDILITPALSGPGPLVSNIEGPAGQASLSLPAGPFSFSTALNILPGDYTLTVYDMAAGNRCAETFQISVPDSTPPIKAIDDFYESPFGLTISGNMLGNDLGLAPELTMLMQAEGGIIEFTKDGSFTFKPDEGFSGLISYPYQIKDTCGHEASAVLNLRIAQAICDFTVRFANTNASCGLADGSARVSVDSPGVYQFLWNDGQSGAQANGLKTGAYTVLVKEAGTGCELEFETRIEEEIPKYFLNPKVNQPTCNVPGDVLFEPNPAGGRTFELEVIHPEGQNRFQIPAGSALVYLSSYLALDEGIYILKLRDIMDTAGCTDVITVDIKAAENPLIQKGPVVPPSGPSASNGSITVTVTKPGKVPYRIRINQADWGITSQNPFKIQGLAAGFYRIQIQDANLCLSNILEVELGISGLKSLEVGFGFSSGWTGSPLQSEQAVIKSSYRTGPVISVAANFQLWGIPQENHIAWLRYPGSAMIRFSHLFKLFELRTQGISFQTSSGLTFDIRNDLPPSPGLMLKGGIAREIGEWYTISATSYFLGYFENFGNAGYKKYNSFFYKFMQGWRPAFELGLKRKLKFEFPRLP